MFDFWWQILYNEIRWEECVLGKKLYTKENISKAETEWLGIPGLVVLKTNSDDVGLEVVHRRYFEDEKLLCPACRSSKTRCSKIVDRKLKDLLWLDEDHKLEYYRLEKTYEGAIELESKPGSWKPTQPKRAGGQKDRTSPLDEIIQRINEEFYGEFTDADRVMVDTLYQKMRKDSKAKKAAKTEDRQVYERSLFPGIFDTTAQEAYMENTAAYEQLFLDADKYQAVMRALADRLYKELHDDK